MIACKDSLPGRTECTRYDCPRHTLVNTNNVKARFKDQCGRYEIIPVIFVKQAL